MSAGLRTSAIIRCLNEVRHLPVLLRGMAEQTRRPDEIIVVDSGSSDGTVDVARSLGARAVRVAREEFSFGRALNRGAEAATGDILIIVSAHVYPASRRWLEELLQPFADESVALVYGRQQGDHRTKWSEHQLFHRWFPLVSAEDQAHDFCNNANAAVRRSVWATMPYDEEVPGLEDIQWARRARQRGFKIAYSAEAVVVHVHEETYRQIYRRYRREAIGLRAVFPGEHMRAWQAFNLFARTVVSDLREARRASVLTAVAGSVLAFRAAQYWGMYRGLGWRAPMTEELRARLYYPEGYHPRPRPEGGKTAVKPVSAPPDGE